MPATQYAKCTELFKFPAVDLNTEPLPSRHEYVNDTNHFLPYQYFTEFLETALSFSYIFINSGTELKWPLVSCTLLDTNLHKEANFFLQPS